MAHLLSYSGKERTVGGETRKMVRDEIVEGPVYHGMEVGIYPKSVPSPFLPTSCYRGGL